MLVPRDEEKADGQEEAELHVEAELELEVSLFASANKIFANEMQIVCTCIPHIFPRCLPWSPTTRWRWRGRRGGRGGFGVGEEDEEEEFGGKEAEEMVA